MQHKGVCLPCHRLKMGTAAYMLYHLMLLPVKLINLFDPSRITDMEMVPLALGLCSDPLFYSLLLSRLCGGHLLSSSRNPRYFRYYVPPLTPRPCDEPTLPSTITPVHRTYPTLPTSYLHACAYAPADEPCTGAGVVSSYICSKCIRRSVADSSLCVCLCACVCVCV